MPFDNTIVTVQLTGAEVKLALEQALRGDRVTQVSGIRYTFDSGRPDGQRIMTLTLRGRHAARRREDLQGGGQQLHGHGRRQLRRARPRQNRADTGSLIRGAHGGVGARPLQGRRQALDC